MEPAAARHARIQRDLPDSLRSIAAQRVDPVGQVLDRNGEPAPAFNIQRVRTPLGVIGCDL